MASLDSTLTTTFVKPFHYLLTRFRMKKFTFLFLGLFLTLAVQAQSPRLVLVEEFTGETCPPCAANNPGMNAIIDANAPKVISLKYQNNIPSAGANLYAYNTVDIANRTTYYANNYSPHAFLDGNVWDDNAGDLTEALVLDRAAVPTPFTVAVSHTFSADKTEITTVTTVTANTAVTSPNYKLRIAVSERNVYGYTSPNGEAEFSHVMRKMLPTGTGLALPASWTAGQTETFTEKWIIKVPTGTVISKPVWALLEVISFVQNDDTKEIIQAGHSEAQVTADAALVGLNSGSLTCSPTFAPEIEVENIENGAITSLGFNYTIDNGTAVTYDWTGNLAAGANTTITLPSAPLSPGGHTLKVNITSLNGAPDEIPTNNTITVPLGSPTSTTAIVQAFAATTWPPANWLIGNADKGAGWIRSTAGFNGAGSAKMDFYNSTAGNIDYLYAIEALDLTPAAAASTTFRFDLSHRRYDTQLADRMDVEVSTDCGATWTTVWTKTAPALATVTTPITTAFTPTLASQWRGETVDLSSYAGQSQVLVRFVGISDYGNNLYIDNVNTLFTSSIDDLVTNASLEVYPNPASESITLDFSTLTRAEVGFQITNALGQIVTNIAPSQLPSGAHKMQMPVNDLANGLYFITLNTNEGVLTRSFTVAK
jgi:Secretion system C-terminal sorting domain